MTSKILKEIETLPSILSIREVADFFSVDCQRMYRLIYKRKLPAWKDDEGRWCIARSDLRRFCAKSLNL